MFRDKKSAPQPDLAHLTVADAMVRDTLSVLGAADNLSDLDFTVDRNPYKQGKFLPGTHIPILTPDKLIEAKPDYVLILPWNFKDQIIKQMAVIREWGGKFVVPIPTVEIIP